MPYSIIVNEQVTLDHKWLEFSDGAQNFQITQLVEVGEEIPFTIRVSASTTDANSVLWDVLLIADAIRQQYPNNPIELDLDYLPHARADRKFVDGNPIPLKVFGNTIAKSGYFSKVRLIDPHTYLLSVFGDLPLEITPQKRCFLGTMPKDYNYAEMVIVAPDEGSVFKASDLATSLGVDALIQATKHRDPETGRIVDITLPKNLSNYVEGRVCIIPDDICDGGGTFLPIAAALKAAGAKSVELYVTHGIFARGLDIFIDQIDRIHVYQIVSDYISRKDLKKFNGV